MHPAATARIEMMANVMSHTIVRLGLMSAIVLRLRVS